MWTCVLSSSSGCVTRMAWLSAKAAGAVKFQITSFVLRMLCGLNLRHRWSARVVENEPRPGWRRGRAANAGDSLETEVVFDLQSFFAHDEVLLPLHQSGVGAAQLSNEGDFRILLSGGFP